MKELSIANFKYGLDSRREALTSLLGTLVQCENAHINPGGEVEKRKAFVDLGQVDRINGEGDAGGGAFIMIGDVGYFYPFRLDALAPDVFPFDVNVVSIYHPAYLQGADFINITAINFICIFDSKVFLAATFADGSTFLYYDAQVVSQSANGRVLLGLTTLSDLATQLAAQVNELAGWQGIANVDQNGVALDGNVVVKSPQGEYYTAIPSVESANGFLGATVVDTDNVGTAEVKATSSFLLTRAADGTVTLTAPANEDGSGTAELTGGAVSTAATDLLMAAKIVQQVNDLTVIHGYTAANNGATISVYAPIGWGTSANGFNLTVTVTGGMGTGGSGPLPTNLSATITPSPLSVTLTVPKFFTGKNAVSGVLSISASGGTAPYTYLWSDFGPLSHQNGAQLNASLTVFAQLLKGESLDQVMKCTVTDSAAGPASVVVYVSVHFAVTSPGDD